MIMKYKIIVGPNNETISGLKLLLTQITQWCDYNEEVMNITTVKPNKNTVFSDSLDQSSFTFRICDISLLQDQTGSVYFYCHKKINLMSTLYQR